MALPIAGTDKIDFQGYYFYPDPDPVRRGGRAFLQGSPRPILLSPNTDLDGFMYLAGWDHAQSLWPTSVDQEWFRNFNARFGIL